MKGKMTVKEVSSSQKFFTVQFHEEGSDEPKTTKVPARKGKSLRDQLENIIVNHNLSFDKHAVFLESSKTPLPLTNDTFVYGGMTLHIKAIEDMDVDRRIVTMMRSDSRKSVQQDVTKRFSELLVSYEVDGLDCDETDAEKADEDKKDDFFLENSWKEIITNNETIPDKQRVQQEAIWELFATEISYIRDIKIIIDVFQKCFRKLQEEGYLKEVEESLIFANIEEIYDVNCSFWFLLKEVVDTMRANKDPIKPSQLKDAFEEFEDLFQPYIAFCNADTSNLKLPNYEQPGLNDMINKFLTWCDNHEQCKRIKMSGFLIKPLQRVTKYSLLLRAISHKTEDEKEKALVEDIMSRVETFVSKINKAVHMRQEHEKLISVITKFESYRPTESLNDEAEKILSEYCSINLKGQIPGLDEEEKRFILKDGPMKIADKQGKKDVHAFLFSDVFVITKLKRNIDKYRIVRPLFRLNKVILRPLRDAGANLFIYLNEYGVASCSFVLQINPNEQAKWITAIEKAKSDYDIKRSEYCLREDFLDEDLPNSSISKNKLRKLQSGKKLKTKTDQDRCNLDQPIEWTNVKIIFGITVFAILNVLVSKLFGY